MTKKALKLMKQARLDKHAYELGHMEPRYPVPAHHYGILFTKYTVEIVIGVTKQWYPTFPAGFQGPYYDCDLVVMWTAWPEGLLS